MQSFVQKLFDYVSVDGNAMQWLPHGSAFTIVDLEKFVEGGLHVQFDGISLDNFQTQLQIHHFKRIKKCKYQSTFFHPFFQKGKPELLDRIVTSAIPTNLKLSDAPIIFANNKVPQLPVASITNRWRNAIARPTINSSFSVQSNIPSECSLSPLNHASKSRVESASCSVVRRQRPHSDASFNSGLVDSTHYRKLHLYSETSSSQKIKTSAAMVSPRTPVLFKNSQEASPLNTQEYPNDVLFIIDSELNVVPIYPVSPSAHVTTDGSQTNQWGSFESSPKSPWLSTLATVQYGDTIGQKRDVSDNLKISEPEDIRPRKLQRHFSHSYGNISGSHTSESILQQYSPSHHEEKYLISSNLAIVPQTAKSTDSATYNFRINCEERNENGAIGRGQANESGVEETAVLDSLLELATKAAASTSSSKLSKLS